MLLLLGSQPASGDDGDSTDREEQLSWERRTQRDRVNLESEALLLADWISSSSCLALVSLPFLFLFLGRLCSSTLWRTIPREGIIIQCYHYDHDHIISFDEQRRTSGINSHFPGDPDILTGQSHIVKSGPDCLFVLEIVV